MTTPYELTDKEAPFPVGANLPQRNDHTPYELTDKEAALIDALRGDDAGAMGIAFGRALPDWLQHETSTSEAAPIESPAIPAYAPKHKSRLRLWLMKHGIEFEAMDDIDLYPSKPNVGNIMRHFLIAVNHRYFSLSILIDPEIGVFYDELDTPHAEIAAQYEREQEQAPHA